MKKSTKLIVGITTVVAISAIIIATGVSRKRRVINDQRGQVAEEGYETAYDILFPLKINRLRARYNS